MPLDRNDHHPEAAEVSPDSRFLTAELHVSKFGNKSERDES